MLEGRDIICFSNDWDGDPLSKKHIMGRLARKNRILWVNSIGNRAPRATVRDVRRLIRKAWLFTRGYRSVADNIFVLSPVAVPIFGSALARRFNRWLLGVTIRRACRRLGFRNTITWTFVPSSADVAGTLGERLIVYQCVDEFSEFTGTDKAAIVGMEQQLMRKADVVIVSSQPLYERKREHNKNTFLVTHGVDIEHFRLACDPSTTVPPAVANLRRPVIGFFGLIADWVDLGMVRHVATARPDWSVVLIGQVQTDLTPVVGLANVHLLGRAPYADLPAYCKGFDVAIVPFVLNDLTHAANPLKVREYLGAGLRVVGTAIPEVERFDGSGLVAIGRSPDDFLAKIEAAIAANDAGPRLSRSSAVDGESWDSKVQQLSDLISEAERRLLGATRDAAPARDRRPQPAAR